MEAEKSSRGYAATVLGCYCPRCREGKLFEKKFAFRLKSVLKMNKYCPVCGQPTEIEVGFYYGTGYVSYFIAVLLTVISALLWWLVIGFSTDDNRFIYWLIFNSVALVCLQPWLMRFARSLWLSWFVSYDPYWRDTKPEDVSERMNDEQGNNW
ncbi:DUF983 domain-containing protein [Niabella soli]|uniref:DUF983 domain-containing protein n=1 Tax=Niabella soli DSM 19437 TaxID=929713 RepID=W0EY17_9BACT|nr:DUF983 domain-containing protein [Niabella soli]AHF15675.1 hypothetical protein NIASO_11975 [Niabella soli DSM 19437]